MDFSADECEQETGNSWLGRKWLKQKGKDQKEIAAWEKKNLYIQRVSVIVMVILQAPYLPLYLFGQSFCGLAVLYCFPHYHTALQQMSKLRPALWKQLVRLLNANITRHRSSDTEK